MVRCSGSSRSAGCCRLPVHLLRGRCPAQGRGPLVGARHGFEGRDTPGVQREFPGLWRAESLTAIAARRLRHRRLHLCSAYEGHGASRHHSRQSDQNRVDPKRFNQTATNQIRRPPKLSECLLHDFKNSKGRIVKMAGSTTRMKAFEGPGERQPPLLAHSKQCGLKI